MGSYRSVCQNLSETAVVVGGDLGAQLGGRVEWKERVYGVSSSSFSAPETVKDTDTVKHGRDPEAGGQVVSGLSPCLLPHPAPSIHCCLFFSFWEEGERMESDSVPPPLSNDMGRTATMHSAVSTCFATGLSRLIRLAAAGSCRRPRV